MNKKNFEDIEKNRGQDFETDKKTEQSPTINVVGVRFKPAGKIYHFNSGSYALRRGDHAIVETEHGLVFGTVAIAPVRMPVSEIPKPLKKVYRPATEDDLKKLRLNSDIEKEAHRYCRECVKKLGLKMNLFAVESNFDGTKLTFFFTADGRVDFRALVKMLAKRFKSKIEMRQVGIRNQAKMCGGIGRCGRELCCSAFMLRFDPVTIKMAKKQRLSLNPTKISGVCGRLMCCLGFEHQCYDENEKTRQKEQVKKNFHPAKRKKSP